MPCESCNVQFTVFKRKKSCAECRRLYCTECLNKRRGRILCERCVIFTSRPLSKIELLKLKPKDLIFYLQSKHISTSGCVEKEELVNLILIHVNNSSNYVPQDTESNYSNSDTSANSGNPFDHLKQTCQNLFSSFTEKISTGDFVFDSRGSYNETNGTPQSNVQQKPVEQNIFTQPRATASTVTPTTSISSPIIQQTLQQQQQQNRTTHTAKNSDEISNEFGVFQCTTISPTTCGLSSQQSSVPTSPVFSLNSINFSSTSTELSNVSQLQQQQQQQQQLQFPQQSQQNEFRSMLDTGYRLDDPQKISINNNNMPTVHNQYIRRPQQQQYHQQQPPPQQNKPQLLLLSSSKEPIDVNASGCECSDDETILYFQNEFKNDNLKPNNNNNNGAGSSTQHSSKLAAIPPAPSPSLPPPNNITKFIESSLSSNGSSFEDITSAITTNPTTNDNNNSSGCSYTAGIINKSTTKNTMTENMTTTNDSDSNWQFIKNPASSSSPSSGTSTSFINIPMDIDVTVICYDNHNKDEDQDGSVNVASVTSAATTTTVAAAAAAATATCSNTDTHRIKNKDDDDDDDGGCGPSKNYANISNNTFPQLNHSQKSRRLMRHRSDGYVTTIKNSKSTNSSDDDDDDDNDDDGDNNNGNVDDKQRTSQSKRSKRSCCDKCGKSKRNLRKSIDKFRRQLEMENVSESDIKAKLNAFLIYLDDRSNKSQLSDDTESIANVLSSPDIDDQYFVRLGVGITTATATDNPNDTLINSQHRDNDILIEDVLDDVDYTNNHNMSSNTETQQNTTIDNEDNEDDDDDDNDNIFYPYNENDGINVYGSDANSNHQQSFSINARQFINIADFQTDSDLHELTVKQLKEILMLNRIDFKGCCEKTELLERVKRLWNEHNACPIVEKLPLDDLCKICMDAPIECVILECGHMATCTNCGKVLSECPICRQYIVRVVRFFRA